MSITWNTPAGRPSSAAATVAVTGDLDIVGSVRLRETVHHLVDDGHVEVTLDLGGVDFMDCAGVGALVDVRRRVREAGGELALGARTRAVTRVLSLVGLQHSFAAA